MLLVSFGSPSAIGYAVMDVIRAILDGCVGAHAAFHVIRMEDVKEKWQASAEHERAAVLITSDCPHLDVVSLCLSTRGPIILSCDTFDHIVAYLMRAREMGFAPAIRLATQVVCALGALAHAPNVLRISSDDYGRDVGDLAAAFVTFTGLSCSDESFDAILRGLRAGGREPFRTYVERNFPHFSDERDGLNLSTADQAALSTVASAYDALIEGHRPGEIVWPPALFSDADRSGLPLAGAVELLGPARFIVYGPYLHLPVGRWRMSVEGEVRGCLSDNRLGADVFSGRVLAAATMRLPAEGLRGFDLDFEVTDPFLPVELRLQLLTGAIEGSFRLLDVRLSRKDGDGGATPAGRGPT